MQDKIIDGKEISQWTHFSIIIVKLGFKGV